MTIFTTACDDDEIINELTLDRNEVALLPGAAETVNIKSGNDGYVAKSANTAIATATVQNKVIKITAIGAGKTSINVTDHKGKTAAISVLVKALLSLEKSEVAVLKGKATLVAITSGSGKYTAASSDKKIATAKIEAGKVKIMGIEKGQATITITDTDTKKTEQIKVVVKPLLNVAATEVTVIESESTMVTIQSGSGKYTAASSDKGIATAKIEEGKVKITGVAKGQATITITDTDTNLEATIKVTVDEKIADITVEKDAVEITETEMIEVMITAGSGKYEVISADEATAKAEIKDAKVVITGTKAGETTVTVTDTVTKKEANIKVTVNEKIADIAVEKDAVEVKETEMVEVMITAGSGKYEVVSADETIAKAELKDAKVVIAGVKAGATTITVKDTVTKKEANIKVTVNEKIADIEVEKDAVEVTETEMVEVMITAGSGEYEVMSTDETIAKAELKESKVVITGVKAGETTIIIKDTKTEKTQEIKVVVTIELTLERAKVIVKPNGNILVAVVTGSGSYEATSADEAIATATIEEGKVKISGIAKGDTTVTVKDTKTNQTKEIKVTVSDVKLTLEKEELKMIKGNYETVNVTEGSGKYEATSSDEAVASVSVYGNVVKVSAISKGDVIVTVKDTETNEEATIKVKVEEEPPYLVDENGLLYKREGYEPTGDLVLPDEAIEVAPQDGGNTDGKVTPFDSTQKVTSIDFNNVTKIGRNGVYYCKNLTTIRLRKLKRIEKGIFYKCGKLKEVYCYMKSVPSFAWYSHKSAFKYIASDAVLYVPKGTLAAYKSSKFKYIFTGDRIKEMSDEEAAK